MAWEGPPRIHENGQPPRLFKHRSITSAWRDCMKSSWRSPDGGSSVAPNTKIEPSEAVFRAWWSTASTPIRSFHTVSGKEILGSPYTGCCIVTSLETVIRLVKKSCAPRTDHNLCRLE